MSTLTVSVGPQHPGSGHFRIIITLDGDTVVDAQPDPGYVHRTEEKIGEQKNYYQNIPHLERPIIPDSCGILYPYVLAVEELLGIRAPVRAQFLRAVTAELNRLIKHLYWLGIYGIFLGHSTMFMWPMGDRELFIELAQRITGARVTFAYFVPGGVRNDMPEDVKENALKHCSYFEERLDEYDKIFFSNPAVLKRTQGVGVLRREDAIELGCVGPTLRGSGVKADVRVDEPYDVYDQLEFEVPVLKEGDSYARAKVHYLEMRQSISIIRQALEKMPSGSVRTKLPTTFRPPPGEAYARAEAAGGAMCYYIVSDGGAKPYRLKLNSPSFKNLIAMPFLLKGYHMADVPTIFWSLDYWPMEADR